MLEANLDALPRTLRFFVNDEEQPMLVSHIPQSINFAVCVVSLHYKLISQLDHVRTYGESDGLAPRGVSVRCTRYSGVLRVRLRGYGWLDPQTDW
jgi:hypothetical protein